MERASYTDQHLGYSFIDEVSHVDPATMMCVIEGVDFKKCHFPHGMAFLFAGGTRHKCCFSPRGLLGLDPATWAFLTGAVFLVDCTFDECNFVNSFCIVGKPETEVLGITEEELLAERTHIKIRETDD